ncbi:CAMK/CAMK1 protein kinase [Apiospora arundinis]
MANTRRHIAAAFAPLLFAQQAVAGLYPGMSNLNHTCSLVDPVLSCSAGASDPSAVDTCCTETFGGLVLATQFWNTYTGFESQGQVLPKDAWTLHGLWPDFCNGSYTQYCDLTRQYDPLPAPNTTTGKPDGTPVPAWKGPDIGTFLAPLGKLDLLAWMTKHWVAQPGWLNGDFWGHEFSKHATCYSTFDVECYGPKYQEHEEVADFFETAAAFHRKLPTWSWLEANGIRPSNATTFSLTDFTGPLTQGFGAIPFIGCSGPKYNATEAGKGSTDAGYTVINEVWYYYHVYGRVQRQQGLAVDANITGGRVTNCAKAPGALHYYERTAGSEACE